MDGLTEQQQRFVAEFVSNGGNGRQACIAAGYAEDSASQSAYKLLRKEHVLLAIRREEMRVLGAMSAQALHVIQSLMADPGVSPAVRLDCAKTTLDRSGFVSVRSPSQAVVPGIDKPLNECSMDELRALVGALESIEQAQQGAEGPTLN